MKIKTWLLLLLIAFSLFPHPSCQDRLFDNPFDPRAGEIVFEVVSTILTPSYMPLSLTWDGSTIWNVDGYNETLYSLNRLSGAQVRALTSPLPATTGIAYDGQDLWVCSELSVDVYKINLLNGAIQKRLNLQRGSFTAIEYGLGSIWLADIQSNMILRVDPETAEIISSFPSPGVGVDGLAFDGTDFWISDSSILTIYQITTDGTVLRAFLSPGQSPRGLAFDGHFLWNVDGDQKIYQLRFQN
jgi:hypothetical protein